MLKLIYAPGACSLSPHIAFREAGIPFELEKVDFMRGKTLASGGTLSDVNPKGYVPALLLDDGQLLTEGAVLVQYIADMRPESGLAPKNGTFERVRLQEWLNFLATELHKGLGPLFSKDVVDPSRQQVIDKVKGRLAFLAKSLEGKTYLLGDTFTVADGYAFYNLRAWQRSLKQELPEGLVAYYHRIAERPAVRAALEAEGLTA